MIKETAFVELAGVNEQLVQNSWSGSVNVPIKAESMGIRLVGLIFHLHFDQTAGGAAMSPTGTLAFFKGDPSVVSGTLVGALTAAQLEQLIFYYDIAAADWDIWRAAGADALEVAYLSMNSNRFAIPRMADDSLYAAFLYTDATTLNSAANDQEQIEVKVIYSAR
jgi:hypothetical protein